MLAPVSNNAQNLVLATFIFYMRSVLRDGEVRKRCCNLMRVVVGAASDGSVMCVVEYSIPEFV